MHAIGVGARRREVRAHVCSAGLLAQQRAARDGARATITIDDFAIEAEIRGDSLLAWEAAFVGDALAKASAGAATDSTDMANAANRPEPGGDSIPPHAGARQHCLAKL